MGGISLTRQQAVVLGAALLVLLALGGKRLASAGTAEEPHRAAPLAVAGRPAATSARLVVHV
ncbi:MAG TPA: hypothetical protein VJ689_11760, partial [Gaiellaceae bacterium]|nr:hypothetical protein [Gaiellaceae bacterium]